MEAHNAFDPLRPTKLCRFLHACQLIFQNDEWFFFTDSKKVLCDLTFLTGPSRFWLEPFLQHLDNTNPSLCSEQLDKIQQRALTPLWQSKQAYTC